MKLLLLSLACMTTMMSAIAQVPAATWARQFSSNSGAIVPNSAATNASGTISVDRAGDVYTMGTFSGIMDFDPGAGTSYLNASEGSLFVSKLDASGAFIWAKNFGDTAKISGYAMIADGAGNTYITGSFQGIADLDPGVPFDSAVSGYNPNLFITKLSPAGDLLWSRSVYDLNASIYGLALATDASGNVYTMGSFTGSAVDFDPGADTLLLNDSLGSIFIMKLNSAGNLTWAKNMAGANAAEGLLASIAVDTKGNVYAASNYQESAYFDPGVDTMSMTASGGYDVFILKLDSSGHYLWSGSMGGPADDYVTSIAADAAGNVYTAGYFSFSGDFDPGVDTFTLTADHNTNHDIFLSKLDASGHLLWAKSIGSDEEDKSCSVKIDAAGYVYLSGNFGDDIDITLSQQAYQIPIVGSEDAFILKIHPAGDYLWVKHIAGISDQGISTMAVDASDNVYAGGPLSGTIYLDAGVDTFSIQSSLAGAFFVYKAGLLPSGIVSLTDAHTAAIYPSPTSGKVNVILSQPAGSSIEVYDLLGALIHHQTITDEHSVVDMSAASDGLYFIRIMHGSELVATEKIVKQ